jgi:hypothetical protein
MRYRRRKPEGHGGRVCRVSHGPQDACGGWKTQFATGRISGHHAEAGVTGAGRAHDKVDVPDGDQHLVPRPPSLHPVMAGAVLASPHPVVVAMAPRRVHLDRVKVRSWDGLPLQRHHSLAGGGPEGDDVSRRRQDFQGMGIWGQAVDAVFYHGHVISQAGQHVMQAGVAAVVVVVARYARGRTG